MTIQGRCNLVKTGWARPQILTTSTISTYKLLEFCNFEGILPLIPEKLGGQMPTLPTQ